MLSSRGNLTGHTIIWCEHWPGPASCRGPCPCRQCRRGRTLSCWLSLWCLTRSCWAKTPGDHSAWHHDETRRAGQCTLCWYILHGLTCCSQLITPAAASCSVVMLGMPCTSHWPQAPVTPVSPGHSWRQLKMTAVHQTQNNTALGTHDWLTSLETQPRSDKMLCNITNQIFKHHLSSWCDNERKYFIKLNSFHFESDFSKTYMRAKSLKNVVWCLWMKIPSFWT